MSDVPFAWDANQLSVVILAAALLLMWFSLIRTQRRKAATPLAPEAQENHGEGAPSRGPSPSHTVPPVTMSQWEVHMHELARELEGRITSKLGLLENLVREADRAAARLESALRAAEHLGQSAAGRVLDAVTEPTPGGPSEVANQDLCEDSSTPSKAEPSTAVPGDLVSPLARPREALRSGHLQEQVYTLADYGYDPEEIAQRTNLPIGEVQLILSLRRTRQTHEPPASSA